MDGFGGVLFFIFVVWPILILLEAANKPQPPPTVNISVPPPPPAPLQPPSPQGPFDLIRHMDGQVRAERIDKIEKLADGRIRAERHDVVEGWLRGSTDLSRVPFENIRRTAQYMYEKRMATGAPGDAESDWRQAEEAIREQLWRMAHPIYGALPIPPKKRWFS